MEEISISKQVQERVSKIEPGTIFGLLNFSDLGHSQAVSLELSRLNKKGTIERLMKGKYFTLKSSRFGKLRPSESQILDCLIKENGGYFGGAIALNRAGVTTQVPSQITIRGARSTRKLKIGNIEVQFLHQGNFAANSSLSNITDIIESIRLIKRTPDGNPKETLTRVSTLLKRVSAQDLENLITLLRNERPYVRAILGALLEEIGVAKAQEIKATLNPITRYKIGISQSQLSNKEMWGIV